jgi:hypothetical protein
LSQQRRNQQLRPFVRAFLDRMNLLLPPVVLEQLPV